MARYTKQEISDARERLLTLCPPGATIYTINVHTARSGMMRHLGCYVIQGGEPVWISRLIAKVCGFGIAERYHGDAVKVSGCGMDVGFHLVHCLSYALHGNKDHGPEATAASEKGRPWNPSPENFRAGYSLNHRWL